MQNRIKLSFEGERCEAGERLRSRVGGRRLAGHPHRRARGRRGARGDHAARLRVLPLVGAGGLEAAAAHARDALDPRAAALSHAPGARWRWTPDGEPAGHVGITYAAERERSARAHPRPRAPVDAVRAPAVVGVGPRARACTGWRWRRRVRQGYELDPPLHARTAPPAPAPSTSARAGSSPAAPFAEPLLGLDLVEYRRGAVIHAAARGCDGALARSRCTRAGRACGWRWRTMVQAGVAVALAWIVSRARVGPHGAVLRAGRGDHRARAELSRARAPGGRSWSIAVTLGHRGRRPARLRDRHRRRAARRSASSSRSALGLFFGSSQLFVNQVAVSAVLVFTIPPPTNGLTFARSLDALTGGVVALVVAAVLLPADPLRLLRDAAKPVLEELAATLDDIAAALRDARLGRRRGGARARARHRWLGERFSDAAREGRETTRLLAARRRARADGRVLRRRGGADRPRRPQRARARPRRDAGARARRERPARRRRRARASSPRRSGRSRRRWRRRGARAVRDPALRAASPPRSCSRARPTCRSA